MKVSMQDGKENKNGMLPGLFTLQRQSNIVIMLRQVDNDKPNMVMTTNVSNPTKTHHQHGWVGCNPPIFKGTVVHSNT